MTHQPHDSLGKAALSRPENASGVLKAVLPAPLLALLDLGSLRLSSASFVSPELAKLHADLVYEVVVAGRPGYVCFVLHELQSTVDPFMPLRVLQYLAGAWGQWLEAHPGAERLPPIVPVVLYHGQPEWLAPTTLSGLIDLPVEGLVAAGDLLPSLRFVLDDLWRTPDTDLRGRELGVFGRLTLLVLKHGRSLEEGASLDEFLREVADLLDALPSRDDRSRVFCYMIVVVGVRPEALLKALGSVARPEVQEDAMNAAEELYKEGERRAAGRLMLEGQKRLFLRQLRARFSAPPAHVEERVAAADEATLQTWAEAILTAQRLQDVFGEEAP